MRALNFMCTSSISRSTTTNETGLIGQKSCEYSAFCRVLNSVDHNSLLVEKRPIVYKNMVTEITVPLPMSQKFIEKTGFFYVCTHICYCTMYLGVVLSFEHLEYIVSECSFERAVWIALTASRIDYFDYIVEISVNYGNTTFGMCAAYIQGMACSKLM